MRTPILTVALPLVLTACIGGQIGVGDGFDCDLMAVSSVQVELVDPDGNPVLDPEAEVRFEHLGSSQDCERMDENTFVCGWEIAGHFDLFADALGYAPAEASTEVISDVCHVETEFVTMTLEWPLCDDGLRFGVEVTPVDASGRPIDAKVEWLPLDGLGHTSPMACADFGQGVQYCAEETAGEIEIWATSQQHGSFYTVVDVPVDDCGPIAQSLTATVDR